MNRKWQIPAIILSLLRFLSFHYAILGLSLFVSWDTGIFNNNSEDLCPETVSDPIVVQLAHSFISYDA